MRIFLDTNILISTILNPFGAPGQVYKLAVQHPNRAVICSQNLFELRSVFERKFPKRTQELEEFIQSISAVFEIIDVPSTQIDSELNIRDIADRPILRSAMSAEVDYFITGDKDFLEAGLESPRILSAAEFVTILNGNE